jgi:nanoRNase/pAp phosphatase (c-di-AMP/oligoRNAs hydrolase)
MPEKPDLRPVLEAHRGERHIIVLQAFPDPDAISSAFAHKLISAQYNIETTLVYSGKISHRQNVALVKLLGIELVQSADVGDMSQFKGAVYVDNQGTTAEEIVKQLEAANVPALIIVDHHEPQERLKAEFVDIRPTGAAATIYTQYLQDGLLELDKNRREHVLLATALMHGILTDTTNLAYAGEDDFKAAGYLGRFRDADLLHQILSQARSKQTMEIIRRALGNRTIAQSFSLAGIGYVRAEDRDAIPQAADFLLSEENVHTAIVYGLVTSDKQQETIIGSMRTSNITIAPDEFLKDVLGKQDNDRYYCGGKAAAGGFEIPVGFLSGDHSGMDSEEYRKMKWQVYDSQIKQKFLAKIGVEEQEGEA